MKKHLLMGGAFSLVALVLGLFSIVPGLQSEFSSGSAGIFGSILFLIVSPALIAKNFIELSPFISICVALFFWFLAGYFASWLYGKIRNRSTHTS